MNKKPVIMKRIVLIMLMAAGSVFDVWGQEISGIGVLIQRYSSSFCDGYFEILDVVKGGPADKAGIRPFTCIYEVDGMYIKGKSFEEIIELIRGPVGTPVTLTIGYDRERKVEIIRETISPELITNSPQLTEQQQEKLRAQRHAEEVAIEMQSFYERFFDLIELALEASFNQFETFLDYVDYRPTHEEYHGTTAYWRKYPVRTQFLDQLGLYNMNQRFNVYFPAQHPYAFGGSFFPLRKGYSYKTSKEYFDKMHAAFKMLINKRFTNNGWTLTEYLKDPEKDTRTSFFIHKSGDDKTFHKYPQIRIEFSGKAQASLYVEAPFDETDKKLMKGKVDPRRNRGEYDTDRAGYTCECLSGDCVNGTSKVKCYIINWKEGKGFFHEWDFTYTGAMKDGMAHGKGKVENVAHFKEGMFWHGNYDGPILITNKDTKELSEYTYEKGKFSKVRSITKEAKQAAQQKEWDEILRKHKSSGSTGSNYAYSPSSRFVVPPGLPRVLEEVADEVVKVNREAGYRLVERFSSKMSSTHTFYNTKYGYRVLFVAITGGNLGKANLEIRNLNAKAYRTAHYPEYFGPELYKSRSTSKAYFKTFDILDNVPHGERAYLRASTWNHTDGYVILLVFEKREL
jgi:hypothetical protein